MEAETTVSAYQKYKSSIDGWKKKNPDKRAAHNLKYQETHRDQLREYHRLYRERNRDKVRQYNSEYKKRQKTQNDAVQ